MISVEKCKKILEKRGSCYNIDEVKKIRDLLYQLANLDYQFYKQKKFKDGKCNNLH